jgi:hypothetical protein
MPVKTSHHSNVLKFWRSIETFSLPDIPVRRKSNGRIIYTELARITRFPWQANGLQPPAEGKQWKHTLYFHIVTKEAVIQLLARLTKSTEFREPAGGNTCLSALVLDSLGQPSERAYTPAAFIYGIKLIREKKAPDELADLLKKAYEEYLQRFRLGKHQQQEDGGEERSYNTAVDWEVLDKELAVLHGLAGNELKPQLPVLCVSEQVALSVTPEAPFLNSYYTGDLDHLVNHIQDIGAPLETLLTEKVDLKSRISLLEPHALLDHLHPKYSSAGRWPSDPAFGLYSAQQAALHLTLYQLKGKSGILGINGPPGTGKTTLLREVIADVVVSRAKRLLQSNVSALFESKWNKLSEVMRYHKMDRSIVGTDGIVVASNNNAAIENMSKELPLLRNIDRESFADAEYFNVIATSIQGEPSWGMLSAVLGKSENRGAFLDKFWFNKKEKGFGRYLKEQYEDPAQHKENLEGYDETAKELKSLLAEYDRFLEIAGGYHDLLLTGTDEQRQKELAEQLKLEYDLPSKNLPGRGFLKLSFEDIHRLTPYSSEKINRLKSNIFLRSLELHEWAIKVNARQMNTNLNAWINMISNKQAETISAEIAAVLWNSFFFCIPVVSVTLASFQRQFSKTGQGAIGWLLLDEAGQATPSSACGAIWRSKRCVIIGDTLQIPPVVTIPEGLVGLLRQNYTLQDDCWSPASHSAQFLADRITATGATIESGEGTGIWTGIPLRAHRRCGDPMFSISNAIAYNKQMVSVAPDRQLDIPTGKSGFIDVQGITSEGHIIIEELMVVADLLQQLVNFEGRIYIISPFRSIADSCREKFYVKDKVECGTIHTFQGKEAEIVLLVLGTQAANRDARDWVASSPNMLNVAVTRAKDRIYVIGNRTEWMKHRYFDYLAEMLPVKEHLSGRLL